MDWINASTLGAALIGGLGTIAWLMIRRWAGNWEDRLIAQDKRLDSQSMRLGEHDVEIATLSADLRHIKEASDETRDDVKELLKIANDGTHRAKG